MTAAVPSNRETVHAALTAAWRRGAGAQTGGLPTMEEADALLDRVGGGGREVAALRAERAEALAVLAPDLATGDRTLPQVAEAALAVARRGGTL